jgi:pimeloyl-ACP methyl ester carboxylesterase
MKITSLFILFLLSFLCLAQIKEKAKDSKTKMAFAHVPTTISKNDSALKNQISEEKYILIKGIEQWVTIKGERSKPIILFLHGGPGSPISPYADVVYKNFEKDFIIVQWDQRGSGRTYGRNSPPEELTPDYLKANPLTLQQMTSDAVELSEYLLKHLGKQKIILFGTSWGSALGAKIATKRPDLFYAYVGHSQIVNPTINIEFYNKIYKMAEDRKDNDALEILNTIGKPPYDRAKNVGLLFRIVKKYEKENSTAAPSNWFQLSPSYDNEKDDQNRSDGDDYSFVNYTGDSKLGVKSMSASINYMKDNLDFKIPVYLIQGNEDILTPKEKTKKYFDKIKAPEKKYYLLPKAAHGFNLSVLEAQYKIFKSIETL